MNTQKNWRPATLATLLLLASTVSGREPYKPPVRESTLPTVAELSKPGALQAYINAQAATHRIVLPPGDIKVPSINLGYRLKNCTIEAYGTRIIGTNSTRPTVVQAQTSDFEIRGLTVVTKSDTAWEMRHLPGSGTLNTKFDGVKLRRVGRDRQGVGLRLARTEGEHTCADILFMHSKIDGFDTAIESNGRQVVAVTVGLSSEVSGCNTVLGLNAGGHMYLDKLRVIGAKTICIAGPRAGGSSLAPHVTMRDVYVDDAGGITRVLDAAQVDPVSGFTAYINSVKCNVTDGEGEGVNLIVGPPSNRYGEILVGKLTKTGRANKTLAPAIEVSQ